MWYFTGYYALGYSSKIKICWYTPLMCRFFGKYQIDKSNGVKVYTYKGVSLMILSKRKD